MSQPGEETQQQQNPIDLLTFRELFNMMPQLGWTARPDGAIEFYNEGWYRYTGKSFEEMGGWKWATVHDKAYVSEVTRRWQHSIDTGTPFEMKFPLLRNDGEWRMFLTRVNPISDADGKIVRWVGINTDIQDELDDQVRLERLVQSRTQELVQARDEAIATSQAKTKFLSTVSHEVKTPLAGIIGILELIATIAPDEETKQMSEAAMSSAQSLLQILNDLLDNSRLEAGKVTIENRTFALETVLRDITQLLTPTADKSGIKIFYTLAADVPGTVCGDELRLRQILSNLAVNAVKFTQEGEVEIAVSRSVAKNGIKDDLDLIRFAVRDTGIGIDEEAQKKLFAEYAQADQSTSRLFGGTGLGLSICKTLTHLMDGTIGVESTKGEGSTFWVELPFDRSLCKI